MILKLSKEPADSRQKALIGTVRGMGGGKTRVFEEIRRVLLLKYGVLPIAITYNHLWSTGDCIDRWKSAVKERRIWYALSLVSRMASVFYSIEFEDSASLIKDHLSNLPQKTKAKDIIRSFVVHAVSKVSLIRPIDTFILLIDEAVKMEEQSFNTFGDEDITQTVREAMLNTPISFNNEVLNVSLIISSLSMTPIGVTKSGRN